MQCRTCWARGSGGGGHSSTMEGHAGRSLSSSVCKTAPPGRSMLLPCFAQQTAPSVRNCLALAARQRPVPMYAKCRGWCGDASCPSIVSLPCHQAGMRWYACAQKGHACMFCPCPCRVRDEPSIGLKRKGGVAVGSCR